MSNLNCLYFVIAIKEYVLTKIVIVVIIIIMIKKFIYCPTNRRGLS